ncbi:MAG: FecR domain-containing protein [Geminicoccaceae bacterium]|nr:FecR domain-containing protein [Geminicoccaceae bacterium]
MKNNRTRSSFCTPLLFGLLLSAFLPHGESRAEDWVYNVQPGDSVWNVSNRHLRNPDLWDKVQERNGIQRPRHLPIGSTLLIPREWLRERPMSARLEAPSGEVLLAYADGTSEKADAGEIDNAGDVILSTGQDGRVSVILGDGSTLDLGPDSRLSFVRLSALGDGSISDIEVKLESGTTATFFPTSAPNPGRFILWTKPAVTSVRGTVFRVALDGSGDTARTEVLEGGVAFTATGEAVIIPASFGSTARIGEPPIEPRPLLVEPDLSGVSATIDRLPATIRFGSVDDASAYRVQVARDRTATSVVLDRRVDVAALEGLDLPDGNYELRVRAIDALGLEGLEAVRPFMIDVRPFAPSPVREGRYRTGEDIRLAWAGEEEDVSYTVELAGSPDMADARIVANGVTASETVLDGTLEPGRYYWQVVASDTSGDESEPGAPAHFDVLLAPSPVNLSAEEGAKGRIDVSWPEQNPRFTYRIELSRSENFEEIERTFEVRGNEDSLPRPALGTWYMRARAIDDDGYAGPFGEPVMIEIGPRPLWAVISIPTVLVALAFLL